MNKVIRFSGSFTFGLILTAVATPSAWAQTLSPRPVACDSVQQHFPERAPTPVVGELTSLADQFRPKVCQQEGGSCHVFAATALLEAACKRRTGKHIDFSEAHLFANHLRGRFAEQKGAALTSTVRASSEGEFFTVDGGRFKETIKLALENPQIEENCFTNEYLFKTLKEKLAKPSSDLTPAKATLLLDQIMLSTPDFKVVDGRYENVTPVSDEVKNCFATPFKLTTNLEPTEADVVALLKRGIPVMCATEVIDPDFRVFYHSSVVMGVEPGMNGVNRFTVRDSNEEVPYKSEIFVCDHYFVIE